MTVNFGARKLCESWCPFPCAANSSEACGADNYMSVYNLSLGPLGKQFVGRRNGRYEDAGFALPSVKLNMWPARRGWLEGWVHDWLF